MDILDRLLGHDAWTTRQLLLRTRELSDEQMSRSFDIGDRSLRETFEHLIGCMEMHTDLMLGRTEDEPGRDDASIDGMLKRLSAVATDFSELASKVQREGRADDLCVKVFPSGNIGKWPLGSVIAHVLTHSMHHRAQVLYLLEQLGVENVIEADALGWEGQARGWGYDWSGSYGRLAAE